jgi:hypothetical protein
MIWKTTNGLNQEVTWYSKEEVFNILNKISSKCDKFVPEYFRIKLEIEEIKKEVLND